jgi:tetratricopeptide (TPR) repeat protein
MTVAARFKVHPGFHLPTLFFGVLVGLLAGTSAAPAGIFVQAQVDLPPPANAPAPPTPTRDPETMRILAEARMHFEAGQDHYANQRYQDAIRSFQAGYALVPRPNFLVNIGQAYRKLGNQVRAKEAYVAYVRALPENSALRDQALQVLAEIEVQLHDGQPGPGVTSMPPTAATPTNLSPSGGLDESPERSRSALWLGAGVGGVGLGLLAAGAGFQWRAKNASDALAVSSQRGEQFDPTKEQDGKRAERYGNRLFIAGGATMLAGLAVFLIIDGVTTEDTTVLKRGGSALALSPDLSLDHVGISWRF